MESMSPILNSLYQKVKERAKAEGIKKIINLDHEDASRVEDKYRNILAFVNRRDENDNLVIAIRPKLINEWTYAHELIHYLNPEVKEKSVPRITTANQGLNIEVMNAIAKGLFEVIIDHFINRLVYEAGIDINIFVEFHAKVVEMRPESSLQRVSLMENYLVAFSMGKYVKEADRTYPKYVNAREEMGTKYPLVAPLLEEIIEIINSVGKFEFENIQGLYYNIMAEKKILSELYEFAVNAPS